MSQTTIKQVISSNIGTIIEGVFLLKDPKLGKTKQNKPYMTATIQDSTGVMKVKYWGYMPEEPPKSPDTYKIVMSTTEYNGTIEGNIQQLTLHQTEDTNTFLTHYISDEQIEKYLESTQALIEMIKDEEYRNFTQAIFNDIIKSGELKNSTAALIHHHVGVGGLLAHSYNVAAKAYTAASAYKTANKDLCIVGGLLHDIGKIDTYSSQNGAFIMTLEGQLVDHIGLGIAYVTKYKDLLSRDKLILVQHMIASHHTNIEWGALKQPKFIEALLVANADYGDYVEDVVLHQQTSASNNYKTPEEIQNIMKGGDTISNPV